MCALAITALRWQVTAMVGSEFWVMAFVQLAHAASFGIMHSVAIQYVHETFQACMKASRHCTVPRVLRGGL